jgi:hypothetical protein
MYFQKQYRFYSWSEWGRTIRDGMRDFYDEYKIYPEYLIANSHTFSQIDFAAKHDLDPNMMAQEPGNKNNPVGGIRFFDQDIVFGIEESVEDKCFLLLISDELDDEDDGGDDDPRNPPVNDPSPAVKKNVKIQ